MAKEVVALNRFDNGLDSLKKALVAMNKTKKVDSDYKDELIFFHNAVELLFKQLLYEAHPLLLYPDVEKTVGVAFDRRLEGRDVFKNAKESLDIRDDETVQTKTEKYKNRKDKTDMAEKLHTIEFMECIRRLIVAENITITGNIYQAFNRLNELRNAITHDELDFQRSESEQTIIDLLPTVIDIAERKFKGAEKGRFHSLIGSKKKKINEIYRDSYINSINSYLSFLTVYYDKNYDDLSKIEKRDFYKTAEIFYGKIKLEEDDMFIEIREEYYITLKSFLSQKLCENLVDRSEFDEFKNSTKLKRICQNNVVLSEVFDDYVDGIICEIEQLLVFSDSNIDFTEKDFKVLRDRVRKHLENEQFILNLFDIYYYILQLERAVDRANWIVTPEKRNGKYETKHTIPENGVIKTGEFIEIIVGWFKYKGWKKEDELDDTEELILEKLKDYPYELLFLKDEVEGLIGTDGTAGTIDKVNEDTAEFLQMYYMIKGDNNKYHIIVEVGVDIETYFDGDYFPGGNEKLLFLITGESGNDGFNVNEVSYLDTFHKPRLEKLMVTL